MIHRWIVIVMMLLLLIGSFCKDLIYDQRLGTHV